MAMAQRAGAFNEGTGVLMGLAFPSMAAYNFTPMFDHVMKSQLLSQNIFSFWFSLDT